MHAIKIVAMILLNLIFFNPSKYANNKLEYQHFFYIFSFNLTYFMSQKINLYYTKTVFLIYEGKYMTHFIHSEFN